MIDETDDRVNDVFQGEGEEKKCESGRESPGEDGKQATPPERVRKRSVLKRSGDSKPKSGCQKRVSFSSVSSERKRRVSNG